MPSDTSNWIISVPVQEEKSQEQMLQDMVTRLVRDSACDESDVAPLRIPSLKTGTLESLIIMAEDLPKIDNLFAAIVSRIVDALRALLNDDEDALNENLNIDGMSVEDYVMSWQWNSGKYRIEKSLNELMELLTKVRVCACEAGTNAYKALGNAVHRSHHEAKVVIIQRRERTAAAA